ncbi:alpha/beta hydrolase [Parabacteroides sp. An277]|uniref:alpha/beta hydrolase n=1 Tax=Parabacteroides sp. An277 TaxID=1965619 RepID=UPI000B3A9004|nr:alpha/beta hydrolase [Parabacteroides sp. An277]OUO51376.1 alpha/beta hydrolase [Parabacteroides sp. An277]
MRRFYWLSLLAWFCLFTAQAQYVHDILGGKYQKRTIEMGNDNEGRVICTLVRQLPQPGCRQAILYLHGYNDYFFQSQLGDSAQAHGYNFYALDLRKYGRSLLPHQDAFYCRSLQAYFADMDTALHIIQEEGHRDIYLIGHSTGGLIISYYMKHHPEAPVRGVALNSPFLDWNFGWAMENILIPTVAWLGNYFPEWVVQRGGNASYSHSLLKKFHGEWEFDTDWKRPLGHPKRAGWIHAIEEAQQDVQKGCAIACPVLVLSSTRSYPESAEWHDEYLSSDIVLSVDDIQQYGERLGPNVERHRIEGGIHDLILSPRPARDEAYRLLFEWLAHIK